MIKTTNTLSIPFGILFYMDMGKRYVLWYASLLFIVATLFGAIYQHAPKYTELSVSFLDVGQGDAIFIQTPEGIQVLVDGGPKENVMAKLKEVMPRGDTSIDMIVVTNPDSDHISGFSSVLDSYTVGGVLLAGTRSTTEVYKALMKKIEVKNIRQIGAYKDTQIILGDSAVLSVLFPDQVVRGWDRNDGSIVMRFAYKDTSLMLMGDASAETEKLILGMTDHTKLSSNILKLGHHGSRTSTSDEWLDVILPTVAIVSAGENNSYGHPHPEVVERLAERGIEVRQTGIDGTITYVSDGQEWVEKNK